MSLIPSSLGPDTVPPIGELPALLKQWIKIQDEAAVLSAELKQRQTQSKALKSVILRIMESNRVAALNISKGTVVHKVSEKPESMNSNYLMKHCKDFFGGDEERAKALVEYLETHRATKKSHDLKLQAVKGDDDGLSHRS
jgi:hypothetical protein